MGGDILVAKLNAGGSVKSIQPFITGFFKTTNMSAGRSSGRARPG
jgi:hypothetical protein